MFANRVNARRQQRESLSGQPSTPSLSPRSTSLGPLSLSGPNYASLDDDGLGDDRSDSHSATTSSRRRARETDELGMEHAESAVRRDRDTLIRYGTLQARLRSVSNDVMQDFAGLSTPQMLINVKGHLLQISASIARSKGEATIEASKKIISNQALEILCNPNIRSYVQGMVAAIMTVVERKPSSFGLTQAILQDQHLKSKATSAISYAMTQRRSSIKTQLEKDWIRSHPTNPDAVPPQRTNIVALTSMILPKSMAPTPSHMARMALLRACFESWKQGSNPTTSTLPTDEEAPDGDALETTEDASADSTNSKTDKFWKYVDDELARLRDACHKSHATDEARDRAYSEEMTAILQDDFKLYSAPPGTEEVPQVYSLHSGSPWSDVIKASATEASHDHF